MVVVRKKPQQQRSRKMVDALIDATGRCVIDHGVEGLTTHHIAEAAGVSVGSLYQYFPNKEALLAALMDRLANDTARALGHLPTTESGDLRANVRLIIDFGFELLHSRDGLYLELARHWHSLPTDRVMNILQQAFLELSRLYFLKHYRSTPVADLHLRIYIIANSVMFTMMRFSAEPQPMLSQEEIARGLTEMVVEYLQAGQKAETGRAD